MAQESHTKTDLDFAKETYDALSPEQQALFKETLPAIKIFDANILAASRAVQTSKRAYMEQARADVIQMINKRHEFVEGLTKTHPDLATEPLQELLKSMVKLDAQHAGLFDDHIGFTAKAAEPVSAAIAEAASGPSEHFAKAMELEPQLTVSEKGKLAEALWDIHNAEEKTRLFVLQKHLMEEGTRAEYRDVLNHAVDLSPEEAMALGKHLESAYQLPPFELAPEHAEHLAKIKGAADEIVKRLTPEYQALMDETKVFTLSERHLLLDATMDLTAALQSAPGSYEQLRVERIQMLENSTAPVEIKKAFAKLTESESNVYGVAKALQARIAVELTEHSVFAETHQSMRDAVKEHLSSVPYERKVKLAELAAAQLPADIQEAMQPLKEMTPRQLQELEFVLDKALNFSNGVLKIDRENRNAFLMGEVNGAEVSSKVLESFAKLTENAAHLSDVLTAVDMQMIASMMPEHADVMFKTAQKEAKVALEKLPSEHRVAVEIAKGLHVGEQNRLLVEMKLLNGLAQTNPEAYEALKEEKLAWINDPENASKFSSELKTAYAELTQSREDCAAITAAFDAHIEELKLKQHADLAPWRIERAAIRDAISQKPYSEGIAEAEKAASALPADLQQTLKTAKTLRTGQKNVLRNLIENTAKFVDGKPVSSQEIRDAIISGMSLPGSPMSEQLRGVFEKLTKNPEHSLAVLQALEMHESVEIMNAKVGAYHEKMIVASAQALERFNSAPVDVEVKKLFAETAKLKIEEKTAITEIANIAGQLQAGEATKAYFHEVTAAVLKDAGEKLSPEFKAIAERIITRAQEAVNPQLPPGEELKLFTDALSTQTLKESLASQLPKESAVASLADKEAQAVKPAVTETSVKIGNWIQKFAAERGLAQTIGATAGVTALMAALWPNSRHEVTDENGNTTVKSEWGGGKIAAVSIGTAATAGAATSKLWAKEAFAAVEAAAGKAL